MTLCCYKNIMVQLSTLQLASYGRSKSYSNFKHSSTLQDNLTLMEFTNPLWITGDCDITSSRYIKKIVLRLPVIH